MRMRVLALVVGALFLTACASTTVVREEAPRTSVAGGGVAASAGQRGPTHLVQAGDTLYGIAFRNSLDWRDIARWNGIGEPHVIQPGQRLRLSPPGAAAARPAATSPRTAAARPEPSAAPVSQGIVGRAASGAPPAIPRGPAGASGPAAPAVAAALPAAAPAGPARPTGPSGQAGPSGPGAFRPGQWQWPTQGQVVSRFAAGDKSRQGIAIAGTAGQPVRAAAAGTVVYSGAGLVGYGELIIIKHSDQWLSAYGHNRRRLVAEGANVAAGQQIAELGRTGTSRDMLHFEIRSNGRPVDPAPLLPAR